MLIPKECIIVGGGSSLKLADFQRLALTFSTKFTILNNYAYKQFEGTLLTCIDSDFYKPSIEALTLEKNPDYYDELAKLPLIICIDSNDMPKIKHSNTILLKPNSNYQREKCLINGFYTGNLTGIFALTLASYLMNYEGTIFLLGYDWTMRNKQEVDPLKYESNSTMQTHYYDNIKHRGIGYLGYYENHDPHNFFKHFQEKKLKIYNVSLESNIETFDKIDYDDFYKLLSKEEVNQIELRESIKLSCNIK